MSKKKTKRKTNALSYVFCETSKQKRKIYKTEPELKSRLERADRDSLYPLNGFYCPSCNGWHVTRHHVIEGKEVLDDKILEWEQKMSRVRILSTSISELIKNMTDYMKWGQYIIARQLLSDARSKICQLRQIKETGIVEELTKKTDAAEKQLINFLKYNSKDDSYTHIQQYTEKKVNTRRGYKELTPKLIQKIDNMIEETEHLASVNTSQTYELIRECYSLIDQIKYGDNLQELKRQWNEKLRNIRSILR